MKRIFFFSFLLLAILNLTAHIDLSESRQKQYSFATIYDSAAPEYYKDQLTDSVKIVTAMNAVDRVEFSRTYEKGATGNLTIPANKTLDFTKGGDLLNYTGRIIGNETVIINPDNHPILSSSATLTGSFIMDYPKPEIFGADGTDDVSDHDAMKQLMSFANICKHKNISLNSESSVKSSFKSRLSLRAFIKLYR